MRVVFVVFLRVQACVNTKMHTLKHLYISAASLGKDFEEKLMGLGFDV